MKKAKATIKILFLALLVQLLFRLTKKEKSRKREVVSERDQRSVEADQEALRTEYGEVAANFRELTDIRFKLLALLPVATILGTVFSAGDDLTPNPWISTFGLLITVAVIVYNERNDQLYGELIARAQELERKLQLYGGQFNQRPGAWLEIQFSRLSVLINHSWAIGWIYKASLIVWLFGVLYPILWFLFNRFQIADSPLGPPQPVPIAIVAVTLATVTVLSIASSLKKQRDYREDEMRLAAYRAVASLRQCEPASNALPQAEWQDALQHLARIKKRNDGTSDCRTITEMQRQAEFYLKQHHLPVERSSFSKDERHDSNGKIDLDTAIFLAATLSGQSVWWIYDTYTGRSGKVTGEGELVKSKCEEKTMPIH